MTSTALVRPTRRTLMRSAAWSVPVVSMASMAPAFAASCGAKAFEAMDLAAKMGSDGTTLLVASTLVGGVTAGPNNLSTNDFPQPGWLELQNNPDQTTETNPSIYQDIKFTFSQSVSSLQFTVSDVDSFGGGGNHTFWDRIAILPTTPTPFSTTPVVAGNTAITGSGTLTDPIRQTVFTDASSASNAQDRQMQIAFTGSTTEVTIRFWSSRSNKKVGTQAVWIGNMTYKVGC